MLKALRCHVVGVLFAFYSYVVGRLTPAMMLDAKRVKGKAVHVTGSGGP
jgi:hypothetical protein